MHLPKFTNPPINKIPGYFVKAYPSSSDFHQCFTELIYEVRHVGSAALSSGALCTALCLTPICASAFRIHSKEADFHELRLKVLRAAHIESINICWVGKWSKARKVPTVCKKNLSGLSSGLFLFWFNSHTF